MVYRFISPPNWPVSPEGWVPEEGWQPPADWPAAPDGWRFWIDDEIVTATSVVALSTPYEHQGASTSEREMVLMAAIAAELRRGSRVESQQQLSAVLVSGKKPNHVVHALITLFTCGLWGFVWLLDALFTKERRVMLAVDPNGVLHGTVGPGR